MKNCILIETKDHRKFLTHKSNLPQLVEFSKTFNAQLSLVKAKEGKVFELEELAQAFCDPHYKKINYEYQVIEENISDKKNSKKRKI